MENKEEKEFKIYNLESWISPEIIEISILITEFGGATAGDSTAVENIS